MEVIEGLTYRALQQMALALRLPSNYKKAYLIQMLRAKSCGTPEEVQSIIAQARRERQQRSKSSRATTSRDSLPQSASSTSQHTPVIHRSSARVRRRLITPDYHEPQPLRHAISLPQRSPHTRDVSQKMPSSPSVKTLKRKLSGVRPIEKVAAVPEPLVMQHYVRRDLGFRKTDGTYSRINALISYPSQSARSVPTPTKTYPSPKEAAESLVIEFDHDSPKSPEYTFDDLIADTATTGDGFSTQPSTPMQGHTTPLPQCYSDSYSFCEYDDYTQRSSGESVISKTETTIQEWPLGTVLRPESLCSTETQVEALSVETPELPVSQKGETPIEWQEVETESQRVEDSLPRLHEVFSSFSRIVQEAAGPIFTQAGDAGVPEQVCEVCPPLLVAQLETLYNLRAEFATNSLMPHVKATAKTRCVYSTPILTTAMEQASVYPLNALLPQNYESTAQAYRDTYSPFEQTTAQNYESTAQAYRDNAYSPLEQTTAQNYESTAQAYRDTYSPFEQTTGAAGGDRAGDVSDVARQV